jgi:hypothetical protein
VTVHALRVDAGGKLEPLSSLSIGSLDAGNSNFGARIVSGHLVLLVASHPAPLCWDGLRPEIPSMVESSFDVRAATWSMQSRRPLFVVSDVVAPRPLLPVLDSSARHAR